MKRLLFATLSLLSLCLFTMKAAAQSGPYGNEWIDYSKTYYKFRVVKAGVYRIPRSMLDAAGLPATVNGSNFMLFRDGVEVPVFVSAQSMSGSDYIEFVGQPANGMLDRELYDNPAWQPDSRISMFTDTASYFLTYDNGTNHLRFELAANNIPGTPPSPEAFNWTTVGNYYKNAITEGPSYDTTYGFPSSPNPGNPFYSPSFDNGEGLVNAQVPNNNTTTLSLATPNAVGSGNAFLRTAVTSRSYHLRHQMSIALNGTQVASGSWGVSETKPFTQTVSGSLLSAANTITFIPANAGAATAYDIYGVAYIELEYPRNYDVAGLTQHVFRLGANSAPQYLEFSNFNGPARLYDLSNRKYYTGDILNGKVRFYLPASLTDRQLVLSSSNTPTGTLAIAKKLQFTHYTAAGNDGDYIIISHNRLMQPGGTSSNVIADYKAYRASANGGGHRVTVADVTELYDQFAYGYDMHPLSIRHFLQYAYDSFSVRPAAVNIIGHGLQYDQYNTYYSFPNVYTFPVVPVYGNPGSDVDFVNFGTDRTQRMQIGRVSVWNTDEVAQYLNKVMAYEAALRNGTDVSALWKKRVMHLAGAENESDRQARLYTLDGAAGIVKDTLMGAQVNTFSKGTTGAVEQITAAAVDSLINSGQSLVTYFGHASPSTLGFNLPEPTTYHASPRFPVFIALGCDVAQMFTVSSAGAVSKTISEKYTLAGNGGAVALLATDNYGYTGFLDNYLYEYYRSAASKNYGANVGLHTLDANNAMYQMYRNYPDFRFYFTQIECQILTGDPALATYGPPKPDYHVSGNGLSAIPANVSIASDSFQLRIISYNLARALRDTVRVKVEHINPASQRTEVRTYSIANLFNTDTSFVWIPVNKVSDVGLNRYHVTIDPQNKFDELSELNNEAELTQFIYSDNLVPVYPHEFAIVHRQGVTLKASTLNPFRSAARYRMELDTTMAFNSPLRLQYSATSPGGLIKWTPALTMRDSTVYYWRSAIDSTINGDIQWSYSSFVYLANGSEGWNQSHYFQYQRDAYTDLELGTDRAFRYGTQLNSLLIYTKMLRADADGDLNRIYLNNNMIQRGPQEHNTIQIMVIDSTSGRIWENLPGDARGALPYADITKGHFVREFETNNAPGRAAAMAYIASVPDGDLIMIKNPFWQFGVPTTSMIDTWKGDTVTLGSGRSLYHSIYNLGFHKVDSFTHAGTFLFMKQKGAAGNLTEQWTANYADSLVFNTTFRSRNITGNVRSTVIGPASQWTDLKWKTHATDTLARNDSAWVSVVGITAANAEVPLSTVYSRDTALTGINATTYPKLRLIWHTRDSLNTTTPQLDYWRVLYAPLPEAALNPAAYFAFTDSVQKGQEQQFSVAIENLTDIPFRDSMLVAYKVINANGVSVPLGSVRYKKLAGLDTLHASIAFDPGAFPGTNSLFVEANPNNDQPEQYHPNNLGYLPFHVTVDKNNPLLDVTFDGAHILDRDIVSAKPFIKISLKDENQYLALNDTSLVNVMLTGSARDQSTGNIRTFTVNLPFDGRTMRFIPGQSGANGKNTAVIELRPDLEDAVYSLTVTGKDRSDNKAGTTQGSTAQAKYAVDFEVINKATVTNVLNYPNPFSTSTAFLFTITGSQIPSQFKIQVLSVTGKVVREITKGELGPLRIGRNMTEYRWDGRDQFGQLLGNGVYMYRVVTSLNGEQLDQRTSGADRFIKNGYGKMYIMR